jgi:hypothetical protein
VATISDVTCCNSCAQTPGCGAWCACCRARGLSPADLRCNALPQATATAPCPPCRTMTPPSFCQDRLNGPAVGCCFLKVGACFQGSCRAAGSWWHPSWRISTARHCGLLTADRGRTACWPVPGKVAGMFQQVCVSVCFPHPPPALSSDLIRLDRNQGRPGSDDLWRAAQPLEVDELPMVSHMCQAHARQ